MRNISDAFKNEINNDNRNYLINVEITLTDGTVLNLDNSDLWENGFKLEDSVSSGSSFQIGSAIINKLTLTLNNLYGDFTQYDFYGAEVVAEVGIAEEIIQTLEYNGETLYYNGNALVYGNNNYSAVEMVKLGTYTVDDPQYNGSLITLECLDNMSKFDRAYTESSLAYPASIFDIVYDCCSCCDVQLVTTEFDNMHIVVQSRPESTTTTFREILQYAAQIACAWAKCDEYGRLVLKWCRQDLLETDEPDEKLYNTVDSISSITTSTDDVVVTGLKVVLEASGEETENKEILIGETGYVLSLEGNSLIDADNMEEIAAAVGKKVVGLKFRPFTLSHLDTPQIEAGDIVKILSFGETYWSIVTSTTFYPGNYQSSSCEAETPSRNSSTQYSEATKTYVEMRKLVTKERTDREVAIANLNKALKESSGLFETQVEQEDGSTIYYLHDKATIEESMTIIKLTAEAIGVSTDGGKTYPYGFTVTGEMITRILYTEGVNADWIRTGSIVAKDKNGKVTFSVNIDTGETIIDASKITIQSKDIEDYIKDSVSNTEFEVGGVNLLHNSKNLVYAGNFFLGKLLVYQGNSLLYKEKRLGY